MWEQMADGKCHRPEFIAVRGSSGNAILPTLWLTARRMPKWSTTKSANATRISRLPDTLASPARSKANASRCARTVRKLSTPWRSSTVECWNTLVTIVRPRRQSLPTRVYRALRDTQAEEQKGEQLLATLVACTTRSQYGIATAICARAKCTYENDGQAQARVQGEQRRQETQRRRHAGDAAAQPSSLLKRLFPNHEGTRDTLDHEQKKVYWAEIKGEQRSKKPSTKSSKKTCPPKT